MRFKNLVLVALSALLLAPASALAAPCCDDKACCNGQVCCKDMAACCKRDEDINAKSTLLPQIDLPTAPVRQVAVVWFMRPVKVGEYVLQGQYLIEHDTDRMAKGLPCTHIYAASKPQVPIVKFHCTHLERARTDRDTVVLQSTNDVTVPKRLEAFQFAGETAAHGVPAVR